MRSFHRAFAALVFAAGSTAGAAAQTIRVLGIDTGSSWDYDTIPQLTGITFTEVTAAGFASVNLSNYDVLMVSDTFTDILVSVASQATLDALHARELDIANWLAAGHGVFATAEPIGSGRFAWMPNAIEPAIGANTESNSLSIALPSHPVMTGLSNGGLSGWSNSSHGNFLSTGGLSVLVTVSGGTRPITLAGNYGLGRIVITDQDPDFHYSTGSTGQMVALVQNAIDWVGAVSVLTTYCTAGTTTHGCSASILATGAPSASAPSGFTITVANVEGLKQGILFYGLAVAASPWASGSTSYKCVASPTQRMGVQNSGGTFDQCDGSLAIDWNAYRAANPGALGSPFSAGEQIFAQAWFRDPPAPKTTNLSNGLRFLLQP